MNTKLIVQLAAILTGSIGLVAAQAQPQTFQNEPGPIQHTPADGVGGSFKLKKDQGGTWSIGTGGACLIADFSASLGESKCVTHDDCKPMLADLKSRLNSDNGEWAYCARPESSNEPKRCWFRPGPQAEYCNISPGVPLVPNQVVQLPKPPKKGVPAFPLNDDKEVRWMVYSCLNGFDFSQAAISKDRLGCGNSDANISSSLGGKPKTLRP